MYTIYGNYRMNATNIIFISGFIDVDKSKTVAMDVVANETKHVTNTQLDNMKVDIVPMGRFKVYTVSRNCELREYIKNDLKLEFRRGCAFYEFKHDFESISKDQEVLFLQKVSNSISDWL